jgi:hypothetical protein
MDTYTHKRVLSIIHIVRGVLMIMIFILIGTFFNALFPMIQDEIKEDGDKIGIMVFDIIAMSMNAIFTFIIFLIPLPSIIGGIAVLNQKNWGFILLMISGCLSLLSFPIGTALGVYTIWVFAEENKQKQQNVEN